MSTNKRRLCLHRLIALCPSGSRRLSPVSHHTDGRHISFPAGDMIEMGQNVTLTGYATASMNVAERCGADAGGKASVLHARSATF